MIERRAYQTLITENGNTLKGLASPVYDGTQGTQYQLTEGIVERFAEGAFDDYLSGNPDVVALWNHDANHVLGRTPNTLRLRTDGKGLHYEVDLPDTTMGKDIKTSIARGDIRGSSFAFVPDEVEWIEEKDMDIRLIRKARLFDVSPVTSPAYGSSNVGLRSNEERKAIETERNDYRNKLQTEKWIARINTLNAASK